MINNENIKNMIKKSKKVIIYSAIGFVAIILACNSFTTISAGEVGIKTRFGKVVNTELNEGLNLKIPFIDKINKMSVKVQKIDVASNGASKDLQDVNTIVAVNYKVNSNKAPELFRSIGMNYAQIVLEPAINESVKSILSEYTAEELITKRQEVSSKMTSTLQNKVEKYGIHIDNFNVTDFGFSEEFNRAIEAKQVAEQNVLKAKQELEKTKIDAEKKIAEANAEAEALKIQKQEITSELLELRKIEAEQKAIEKWNGILPSTVLGDSIPFVNIK